MAAKGHGANKESLEIGQPGRGECQKRATESGEKAVVVLLTEFKKIG